MALDYGNHGFSNPFSGLGLSSQSVISALGVGAMVAEKLPGYEIIQSQLQRFNIDLSTVTTWMMIATALWTVWSLVTRNVYTLLDTYYCCSVRVTSDDSLFHDLFTWLREERAADISIARVCDAKKQLDHPDGDHQVDQFGSPYAPPPVLPTGRQVSQVVYTPTPGALYYFRHNGHTIRIVREQIHDPTIMPGTPLREAVKLKYYGRSPLVLKAVLDDVILRSNQRDQGKTVVYQGIVGLHGQNRWDRCMSRPNRSINTVILEEDQKEKVVGDIEEYLLPATVKWYANRGLPYRRGYLLYGPPGNSITDPEIYKTNTDIFIGTGKTSLSMALAGHFNLEVYALSLNAQNLNDDNLALLFTMLPKRCIVLLEDVDASGVKRDDEPASHEPETPSMKAQIGMQYNGPFNFPSPMKSSVSFSGLINAIDGAVAKEGRILIMTTNHREKLDDALIRPGRVDLQIAFSFASKSVIAELFENLYDVSEDDMTALYMPTDFPSRKEILELSRQFSDLVPEGCFTPAEIQGLLLLHKKNPHTALAMTPAWVEKKLAGKQVKTEIKASVDPS